jgi:hydrogenase nickel incorporation protein HypB
MCRDCGCSTAKHDHVHPHHHHEPNGERQAWDLHHDLLSKNDHQAAHNRELFHQRGVLVLNLLSSPGSGKTKLLERTLSDLRGRRALGVVVGDLQTDNDARRMSGLGAPVVSITTGTVCHLEADMVAKACAGLDLGALDVLLIENVGNLVCPAAFDLGEEVRVVVLSTTEGEDKPLKYPLAFKTAQVVLLNKIDLSEAAGFERKAALDNIRRVAPQAEVIEVSARTGQGMEKWYAWLERRLHGRGLSKSAAAAPHSAGP